MKKMKCLKKFFIFLFLIGAFLIQNNVAIASKTAYTKVNGKKHEYIIVNKKIIESKVKSIRVDNHSKIAFIYYEKAQKDFKLGKISNTIIYCKEALKQNPSAEIKYSCNNLLGLSYDTKNNFALSKDYYLKAIEIKPQYYIAYVNLGSLYLLSPTNQDLDKAIFYLKKGVQINSKRNEAYGFLAEAYKRKALYNDALAIDFKILSINPKDASTSESIADIYYNNLKDYDNAIKYYKKAENLSRNNPKIVAQINDILNEVYLLKSNNKNSNEINVSNNERPTQNQIIIPTKQDNDMKQKLLNHPVPQL